MEQNAVIDVLNRLIQVDIDAVHAYDQAIENIEEAIITDELERFQADHEQHIIDLCKIVKELGGKTPEFSRDFKGYIIEGMTSIMGRAGTEGALIAMRQNEGLANESYSEALSADLTPKIKRMIRAHCEDELRHRRFIERALEERLWEQEVRIRTVARSAS